MLLPLATQSSPQDYSGGRLLNYFYVPTEGPSQGATLGREGLVTHATLSSGSPVRAFTEMKGDIYAACGGRLWKVTTSGTATDIGAINDDSDTQMDASGSTVCLVAGNEYFTSDGSTVEVRATGQVLTPRGVAVKDGYAIVVGGDTTRDDRVAYSQVDDQETFAGLDFFTAESDPDALVAIIKDHSELMMLGTRTTEAYYSSTGDIPFARNDGALMERGILRASTVAKADNAVYWIGDDRKAYRAYAGRPEAISTDELSEYFETQEIVCGFTFECRGRKFYAVHIENKPTWVFCINTGRWQEFSTGSGHDPWTATNFIQVGGTNYFGTSAGTIATMSGYEDEGAVIRAEAWAMPLDGRWNQINEMRLQMSTGVGSLGRDRKINLQTSKDGKTWGNPKAKGLGDTGVHRKTIRWTGLGRFENFFQARLWITDPVQRDIYGGEIR